MGGSAASRPPEQCPTEQRPVEHSPVKESHTGERRTEGLPTFRIGPDEEVQKGGGLAIVLQTPRKLLPAMIRGS